VETPRDTGRHGRTADLTVALALSADNEGDVMRIAVVGRGNVGGGLADLWEKAGHEVARIGRDGGDVSDADVVLFAVPGGSIAEAVENVNGFDGKTAVDATNRIGTEPPVGFPSNAEFLKSKTGGPTAKSFNINFAVLYQRLGDARAKPSNLWCGDDEARDVVEQLNRDAGYEPVYAGGLENAGSQESFIGLVFAINQGGLGPFVYRMAPPDEL
jgi:8-hydroxy-5-deazaflavin:NADPH oxidoreductase